MSGPDRRDERTDDGLVDALGERLSAVVDRGTTTARLALAETRLAASSAALLLGIACALALLVLPIWFLLATLAGYGLWQLGLTPAAALSVLLAVHVALALVLALLAKRLAGDLRFAHTRRALASGAALASAGAPPAKRPPPPPSDARLPARD